MSKRMIDEAWISVDVETAGPHPGGYALLSIGACSVAHPEQTFYVELQPDREAQTPEAAAVHGLSLAHLRQTGLAPEEAMGKFEDWISKTVPAGKRPVFVAFNAPFDWMFVCDYFHRYLGRNPFGYSALDLKAFTMGLTGADWEDTSLTRLSQRYLNGQPLSHHALDDACRQAELFRKIFEEKGS